MWTQIGNCPRCGAPMYQPTAYWSIIPPPVTRTCSCFSDRSLRERIQRDVGSATPQQWREFWNAY